ncbi:hypothetical protein DSECCO2_533930 [anaerobic digester metagenome]
MLARKNDHGIVKYKDIIGTAFFCALTFVMYDACFGKVIILVPGFQNTVRQVNVFAIHEKGLVKQAGFIQCFAPQQHKSPTQYIHLVDFLFVQIGKMIFAKPL